MRIQPKLNKVFIFLVLLWFVTGCGSNSQDSSEQKSSELTGSSTFTSTLALSSVASSTLEPLSQGNAETFNRFIASLLVSQRNYLTQEGGTALAPFNAIDAWYLVNNLALMHTATQGDTRSEFEQFFSPVDISLPDRLFTLLSSSDDDAPQQREHSLWVQEQHGFKTSFVDWIRQVLKPVVYTLPFETAPLESRRLVLDEIEAYFSVPQPLDSKLRLVYSASQVLNAGIENNTSAVTSALFEVSSNLTEITALHLQGLYQQLQNPEGVVTVASLINTNLVMAVIQPDEGHYDYYVDNLAAILKETLALDAENTNLYLPLFAESKYRGVDLASFLTSVGIPLPFDPVLADLRNLDLGGQYVDYFSHNQSLSMTADGLSLDSRGVLTTATSSENVFLPTDGGGSSFNDTGVILTWEGTSLPSCYTDNAPRILSPFLVALVDAKTGAIAYLAEINTLVGSSVVLCGE